MVRCCVVALPSFDSLRQLLTHVLKQVGDAVSRAGNRDIADALGVVQALRDRVQQSDSKRIPGQWRTSTLVECSPDPRPVDTLFCVTSRLRLIAVQGSRLR